MAEYIERDKVLDAILQLPPKMDEQGYGWLGRMGVWQMLSDFPSADVQPVVRCKDCIYKPSYIPPDSEDVWDLSFPLEWQSPCPCYCEDGYYSRMPHDDWFCNFGKRKDGET